MVARRKASKKKTPWGKIDRKSGVGTRPKFLQGKIHSEINKLKILVSGVGLE